MSNKEPSPSRIIQNPCLWPTSFAQPVSSQQTCIRTYNFMDGTKVEKFLDFVKQSFPNRKVDIKQLKDGKVSVSITSTGHNQATNFTRTSCQSSCYYECLTRGCTGSSYTTCVTGCRPPR